MTNKQTHAKKHPPRSKQNKRISQPVKKERGIWLTAAIVIVIIHGLMMLGIIYGQELLRGIDAPPTWFVLSVIGAEVADIVAGFALWRWKKWGLTLYLISTLVIIGLGIVATGYAMMWAFSRLIPFIIVGYIVRSRWQSFE
jgi:hypothetical protein